MLKKGKFFILVLTMLISIFALISCGDEASESSLPESITLSSNLIEYSNISEVMGRTFSLQATVKFKNGTTGGTVRWETPSESGFEVISKDSNNLAYAISKSGRYTIKAYAVYNGKDYLSAQCVITFQDALTSIKLKNVDTSTIWEKGFSMNVGSSIILQPVFSPDTTSQKNVEYSLGNNIASISTPDSYGRVRITALQAGSTTLTVRSKDNSNIYTTLSVTIRESGSSQTTSPSEITLSPNSVVDIPINASTNLTATLKDGFGNTYTNGRINFSSSDPNTVAVTTNNSRSATLRALKGGNALITATYSEDSAVSSQIFVTVTGGVRDVATESAYYAMQVGESLTIDVNYSPENTVQRGLNVSSSNPNTLVVSSYNDSQVTVKALSEGISTLKISSSYYSSISKDIRVAVTQSTSDSERLRNIMLSDNVMTFSSPYSPRTVTATSYIRQDNGSIAADTSTFGYTYELSEQGVVNVIQSGNVFTLQPLKPGSTVLTVTSDVNTDHKASCLIEVGGNLQSLTVSSENVNVSSGKTETVKVTPYPSDALISDLSVLSSNQNIATALLQENTDGSYDLKISGSLMGSAKISVVRGSDTLASVNVNVSAAAAISAYSMDLDRSVIVIDQDGEDEVVLVSVYDKEGFESTSHVNYSLSGTSSKVVSVSRAGTSNRFIISPKNAGVATIEFTTEDNPYISARLRVEVGGSAVQGTSLRSLSSPYDSITVKRGESQNVEISAIPLDAEYNLLWSTSDASVATVQVSQDTHSATICGLENGVATIRATSADNENIYVNFRVIVNDRTDTVNTTITHALISTSDDNTNYRIIQNVGTGKAITLTGTAYSGLQALSSEVFDWSIDCSSDEVVATTNTEGTASLGVLVRGYSNTGVPAVITATCKSNSSVKASFYILATTNPPTAANPALFARYTSITLETGKSTSVPYSVYPATAQTALNCSSTSDVASAVINPTAKKIDITANRSGTCAIHVYNNDKSVFTINVLVVDEPSVTDYAIDRITLNRTYLSYDLATKALQQVSATVYKNGTPSYTEEVLWSVSDSELLTFTDLGNNTVSVDHKGKLGTVILTATSKNNSSLSASCVVEIINSSVLESTLRSITLSSSSIKLSEGQSSRLKVSTLPASFASRTIFVWSSSNESVATVSHDGKVTAHGAGEAVITVRAEGTSITDVCDVTVYTEDSPTYILELSNNSLILDQDADDQIVDVRPLNVYNRETDSTVIYTMSSVSSKVIDIRRAGQNNSFIISPKNSGTATVVFTAQDNKNVTARLVVEVGGSAVQGTNLRSLSAPFNSITVKKGESQDIEISAIPLEASYSLLWNTSDASVASVRVSQDTHSATISGLANGVATIRATSADNPGIYVTVRVTVSDIEEVVDTSITHAAVTASGDSSNYRIIDDIGTGKAYTLTATAYSGLQSLPLEMFNWSITSSSGEVSAITNLDNTNSIGVHVTGYSSANTPAVITATSVSNPAVVARFYILATTNPPTAANPSLYAKFSSVTIKTGDSLSVPYYVYPNEADVDLSCTSSSDVASAVVNTVSRTLDITTQRSGSCAVNVYNNAQLAFTVNVLVVDEVGLIDYALDGIKLDRTYLSYDIAQKDLQKVKATVYKNGVADPSEGVQWSVSDSDLLVFYELGDNTVSVDHKGKLGTVVLTATSVNNPSLSASCAVEIINSSSIVQGLRRVTLSSSSMVLNIGRTSRLSVSTMPAYYADSCSFIWTSSNRSVATVDQEGNVTAVATGTAVIKVTDEDSGLSDSCTISVPGATGKFKAQYIELDKSYIFINQKTDIDTVYTVNATIFNSLGDVIDDTVSWGFSRAGALRDVEKNGNSISFKGKNAGSVSIYASYGNTMSEVVILVGIPDTMASASTKAILINPSIVVAKPSSRVYLVMSEYPEGNNVSPIWTSNNPSVASVPTGEDEECYVYIKANATGKATITCTDRTSGLSAEAIIYVVEDTSDMITRVDTDRASLTFDLSKSLPYIRASIFKDGVRNIEEDASWQYIATEGETDASKVVTLTPQGANAQLAYLSLPENSRVSSGLVKVSANRTNTIGESAVQMYSYVFLDVVDSATHDTSTNRILLSQNRMSMSRNSSKNLIATRLPASSSDPLTFISSNTSVARVDTNGLVTAVGPGSCYITVQVTSKPSVNAVCYVTVSDNASSVSDIGYIKLSQRYVVLNIEDQMPTEVQAEVYDTHGAVLDGVAVTWDTEALGNVAFANQNGNSVFLSARNDGEARLTATVRNNAGDLLTASCIVVTGSQSYEGLLGIGFDSSSPVYFSLESPTPRSVNVVYDPDIESLKGASFASSNGVVSYTTQKNSITLTPLSVGESTITATSTYDSSISSAFNVVVVENNDDLPPVTSIVLDRTSLTFDIATRDLVTLNATAYDFEGNDVTSENRILWQVSPADTVTIEEISNGRILLSKGDSVGDAIISARCGDVVAECTVHIIDSSLDVLTFKGIEFSSSQATLLTGANYTLQLTALPPSLATEPVYSYTGQRDCVDISVNENDDYTLDITALKAGTCTIIARMTVDEVVYETRCEIMVISSDIRSTVANIIFEPSMLFINKDEGAHVDVRLVDINGDDTTGAVSFTTSDVSTILLENCTYTGFDITGLANGIATVKASNVSSSGTVEATLYIAVGSIGESLSAIIINPSALTMKINQERSLAILPFPEQATFTDLSVVSSDESVATAVIEEGILVIRAEGEGHCNIVVNDGVISSSVSVTVNGIAHPASIRFEEDSIYLTQEVGGRQNATAYVYDEDSVRLSSAVSFSVTDTRIASIVSSDDNCATLEGLSYGSTYLNASYENLSAKIPVSVSDTGSQSSEIAPLEILSSSSYVVLKAASWAGEEDPDTYADLDVLFKPINLADAYKGLVFTSGSSSIVGLENSEGGNIGSFRVRALTPGTANVTITSQADENIKTSLTVISLSESQFEEIQDTFYKISLDKNRIRLDTEGAVANVTASLSKNGVQEDDTDILSYILFETQNPDECVSISITDNMATLTSLNKAGYAVLAASYSMGNYTIDSRALVEVSDILREGQNITAVNISQAQHTVLKGSTFSLSASVTPALIGVTYNWVSSDPEVLSVESSPYDYVVLHALENGMATVTVTATLNGVSRTCSATIIVSDTLDGASNYSKIVIDKSSLVLSSNGSATLNATLYDREGNVVEDVPLTWGLENSQGSAVESGVVTIQTIGAQSLSARITSDRPGIGFVTVKGPAEDLDADGIAEYSVTSRALIEVEGSLQNVSMSTDNVFLLQGESHRLSSTPYPGTAVISSFSWEEVELVEDQYVEKENKILRITEKTQSSASIMAISGKTGSTTVRYSASDSNGITRYAYTNITVSDKAMASGGVRQISFGKSFETINYPYVSQSYGAYITYMDGSTASSEDITYTVTAQDDHEVSDIADVAVELGVVKINPKASGVLNIEAKLIKSVYSGGVYNDFEFTAHLVVTVNDRIGSLSTNVSSLVLYTGGSSTLTVTTDNPLLTDAAFEWTLVEENTRQGENILSPRGTHTDYESVFSSIAKGAQGEQILSVVGSTSSMVLGTKTVLYETDDEASVPENVQFISYDPNVLSTFPRKALIRVSGLGQSAYIDVTINLLPEGNSYPASLTFSSEKENLSPPFSEERSLSASVVDIQNGNVDCNLNWYYYPLGVLDFETDEYRLSTSQRNIRDEIECYFSTDSKTMYYKPKTAGLYCLTAVVSQNTQLRRTAIFTIGGDVTGFTSSSDSLVSVALESSQIISAIFTPQENLAKTAFWAIEERDEDNNVVYRMLKGTSYMENPYVNLYFGNNQMTVYGKKGTYGNTVHMHIFYPRNTANWNFLDQIPQSDTFSYASGYIEYDGDRYEVFESLVAVEVSVDKSVYTFNISGNGEVDPSSVIGSALRYNISASATGSNATDFSDWDWVEARLIGADNPDRIYASTEPVDEEGHSVYKEGDSYYVYIDGEKTLYDEAEKGIAYYNAKRTFDEFSIDGGHTWYEVRKDSAGEFWITPSYERASLPVSEELYERRTSTVPISTSAQDKGKINRDSQNSLSFMLDQADIPDEPVRLVVKLRDDIGIEDGYNTDKMAFNSSNFLVYIGGAISDIQPGVTTMKNNGTAGETTTTLSTIQLIEGASAVLTLSYNPTYTHQKEVVWQVSSTDPKAFSYDVNGNEFSIIALKISEGNRATVNVRAISVYDSTKYCDFVIVIQSLVKSITFTATSQNQINKSSQSEMPIYQSLVGEEYLQTSTNDTIICYDITDLSGSKGLVDAFLVESEISPDFGYDFQYDIVSGSRIGSLDFSGIDDGDNSFRFVPVGRIYDYYDDDGVGRGSFRCEYGPVVVRMSNAQINYSHDIFLNYISGSLKIVKNITDSDIAEVQANVGEEVVVDKEYAAKNIWDFGGSEDYNVVAPIETVVLYSYDPEFEPDSFELTIIDDKTPDQERGYFFTDYSDSDNGVKVSWSLYKDEFFHYPFEEGTEPLTLIQNEGSNTVTLVADRTNENAEACEGVFYLRYLVEIPVLDDSGNPLRDDDDNIITTTISNALPIYLISRVNPELVLYYTAVTGESLDCNLIPLNISRSQIDKWYAPGEARQMYDGPKMIPGLMITTGYTYAIYDKAVTPSSVGVKEVRSQALQNFSLARSKDDIDKILNHTAFTIGLVEYKGTWYNFTQKSISDIIVSGPTGLSKFQTVMRELYPEGGGLFKNVEIAFDPTITNYYATLFFRNNIAATPSGCFDLDGVDCENIFISGVAGALTGKTVNISSSLLGLYYQNSTSTNFSVEKVPFGSDVATGKNSLAVLSFEGSDVGSTVVSGFVNLKSINITSSRGTSLTVRKTGSSTPLSVTGKDTSIGSLVINGSVVNSVECTGELALTSFSLIDSSMVDKKKIVLEGADERNRSSLKSIVLSAPEESTLEIDTLSARYSVLESFETANAQKILLNNALFDGSDLSNVFVSEIAKTQITKLSAVSCNLTGVLDISQSHHNTKNIILDSNEYLAEILYYNTSNGNRSSFTILGPDGLSFKDCSSLNTFLISPSVTHIRNLAFSGCTSIPTLTLPATLTSSDSLGQKLFDKWTESQTIVIDGLSYSVFGGVGKYNSKNVFTSSDARISYTTADDDTIPSQAFQACQYLSSLDLRTTHVEASAFANCTNLQTIYLTNGNITVNDSGSAIFTGCTGATNVTIQDTNGSHQIAQYLLYRMAPTYSMAVDIAPSITGIGKYAFAYNDNMTISGDSLPSGVESIDEYAFYNCSSLKLTELPVPLDYVGSYAFYNCKSLGKVTGTERVLKLDLTLTTLGNRSFASCGSTVMQCNMANKIATWDPDWGKDSTVRWTQSMSIGELTHSSDSRGINENYKGAAIIKKAMDRNGSYRPVYWGISSSDSVQPSSWNLISADSSSSFTVRPSYSGSAVYVWFKTCGTSLDSTSNQCISCIRVYYDTKQLNAPTVNSSDDIQDARNARKFTINNVQTDGVYPVLAWRWEGETTWNYVGNVASYSDYLTSKGEKNLELMVSPNSDYANRYPFATLSTATVTLYQLEAPTCSGDVHTAAFSRGWVWAAANRNNRGINPSNTIMHCWGTGSDLTDVGRNGGDFMDDNTHKTNDWDGLLWSNNNDHTVYAYNYCNGYMDSSTSSWTDD